MTLPTFCSSSVRPVISTPVRVTQSRVARQENGESKLLMHSLLVAATVRVSVLADQQVSPNVSGIAASPISTATPRAVQAAEKSLLSRR